MYKKNILRKKYRNLRKNKYFEINKFFFSPLINLMKSKFYKKKELNLALYYPSNFEVNTLAILENSYLNNKNFLLPIIEQNNIMNFFSWKKNEVLFVNKYGILEPVKSKVKVPDIILVPILAYDKNRYRLGYGKGFYDRYLTKLTKKKG